MAKTHVVVSTPPDLTELTGLARYSLMLGTLSSLTSLAARMSQQATAMKPRQRVLLVSYACDPVSSMEARLGWCRAIGASEDYDVTMICADYNEEVIEKYVDETGETPPFDVHFVGLTPTEQKIASLPGMFYWGYNRWHKRVFALAKEIHSRESFELAHQVGLCGYREPGYTWQLGIPFVWGPVGGTQDYPWRFLKLLTLPAATFEVFRSIANSMQLRYRLRVKAVLKNAAKVLAANSTTLDDFESVHGTRAELQLETGLDSLPHVQPRERDVDEPLRILWAGRHRPWKALPLLLHALAEIGDEIEYEVRIIGHDEQAEPYRKLAKKLGVDQHLDWIGWPAYRDTLKHYNWADVFAFTSLRDTSGTGLLEALAYGTPIVGVDHQGAHDVMDVSSSLPIPVDTPEQTITKFRLAFVQLAKDSDKLKSLSVGARERAREFLWSELNSRMRETYRQILGDDTPNVYVDPTTELAEEPSEVTYN